MPDGVSEQEFYRYPEECTIRKVMLDILMVFCLPPLTLGEDEFAQCKLLIKIRDPNIIAFVCS